MSVVDEILKDAMKRGEFDHLPGAGKPLKLEDESHVPEHLRLAHKILRDNDLAPDWIMDGKAISDTRDALNKDVRSAARKHRNALAEAAGSGEPEQRRQHIERVWTVKKAELRERADKLNKLILTYNLKVPKGVEHRIMFDLDREIAKVL